VGSVRELLWRNCAGASAVALYIVHGAGHVWPPYGPGAPQDYSASAAVWSFVSSFALPR
jgi:poly(3-hydroxybutyrate) depolymerase